MPGSGRPSVPDRNPRHDAESPSGWLSADFDHFGYLMTEAGDFLTTEDNEPLTLEYER